MLTHMHVFVTARRGHITFGGLITSIARTIGPEHKLATLVPLPSCFIDIDMARSMNLVKQHPVGKFDLMINNKVFPNTTLPDPNRIDVRHQNNFFYINDPMPSPVPVHIPENVAAGEDTDDEYE
ncbi:unnamed protein product [Vicia faba]|uniref:Uncharacterized protein n=1 Tax=Vicia faba TaxID=3906 RepID=A0AAV0ZVE8_VICFA|nr:unnamed protein product [Vicia faba]